MCFSLACRRCHVIKRFPETETEYAKMLWIIAIFEMLSRF